VSTVKLLNKNATRGAADRRKQAVQELRRMARAFAPGTHGRFRVESLAQVLDELRRDPRFTGAQKDAKFKSLLNRAR